MEDDYGDASSCMPCVKCIYVHYLLILITTLGNKYCYLYSTVEDTVVWRGWVICPKSTTSKWLSKKQKQSVSCSVMSDAATPGPARLLCPWDFPDKNTRVGCHCLLQGISLPRLIFQGSSPGFPHSSQMDSLPSKPPGKLLDHDTVCQRELSGTPWWSSG